jgi:hypothetical protein
MVAVPISVQVVGHSARDYARKKFLSDDGPLNYSEPGTAIRKIVKRQVDGGSSEFERRIPIGVWKPSREI